MAPVNRIRHQSFTLDAVSWTPITAPVSCAVAVLRNKSTSIAVKLRTDDGDAGTEETVYPGAEYVVNGPALPGQFQFHAGDTVIYAQAASGAPVVLVKFA